VPGGARYTTHEAAERLVRRGRATWETDRGAIRLTDLVLASQCHGSGAGGQGVFQWHQGITGGMVQILGSTKYPCGLPTQTQGK
jgi:hypothetical protein